MLPVLLRFSNIFSFGSSPHKAVVSKGKSNKSLAFMEHLSTTTSRSQMALQPMELFSIILYVALQDNTMGRHSG